jgi:hypothetical protein
MNYREKQKRATYNADGVPPRFARFDPFRENHATRIFESEHGVLERHAMFPEIAFVLLLVPFESHNFIVSQILASVWAEVIIA